VFPRRLGLHFYLKFVRTALLTLVVLSTFASASELRGIVMNGSTRKPAVGDEVVLLTLSQEGMSEGATAKTDSAGRFQLSVPDEHDSHLVRVTHQGVTYHKMIAPDPKPMSLLVYDAVEKLDGINAVMDVQRFEVKSDMLEVKQLITMRNSPKPPHTLMKDRAFEIQLPPEAQVQSGLVQIEDGQPLKQKPVPGDEKGQYYFISPLRPGDTRFAVVYRLPYNGEAVIEPKLLNPMERFVVMLPKSMKFEPKNSGIFRPMPNVSPDNVQATGPVKPGEVVTFRISGAGRLVELQGSREGQESETAQKQRPGGGLGVPIDAPDPLQENRWLLLSGIIAILAIGATWSMRSRLRPPSSNRSLTPDRPVPVKSQDRYTPIRRTRTRRQRPCVSKGQSR
jgi:hypothetical protein